MNLLDCFCHVNLAVNARNTIQLSFVHIILHLFRCTHSFLHTFHIIVGRERRASWFDWIAYDVRMKLWRFSENMWMKWWFKYRQLLKTICLVTLYMNIWHEWALKIVCFLSTLETYKFVLDLLRFGFLLSRFSDEYASKNVHDVFKFGLIIQWKLFVSAEWSSLLYFFGDFTAIKCLKLYHISSLIHPITLTTIQIFCFVENHKKCKKEKKNMGKNRKKRLI